MFRIRDNATKKCIINVTKQFSNSWLALFICWTHAVSTHIIHCSE